MFKIYQEYAAPYVKLFNIIKNLRWFLTLAIAIPDKQTPAYRSLKNEFEASHSIASFNLKTLNI